MRTRKCYSCGKRFSADAMEKTPHKEWECESCFCERWEWCGICKEYQLIDWNEPCRHLFWTDCKWMGCGSYDWNSHKGSLFAVLDKVGEDCATAMASAIRDHDFNLQFHGTIFGSTGIWLYVGSESYGHRFTENLTSAEESAMSVGVGWLNSLQPSGVTKNADDETVKWIEEWESNRQRHLTIQYFRRGFTSPSLRKGPVKL